MNKPNDLKTPLLLNYARPIEPPLDPLVKERPTSYVGRFILVLIVSSLFLSVVAQAMLAEGLVGALAVWGGALCLSLADLWFRRRDKRFETPAKRRKY